MIPCVQLSVAVVQFSRTTSPESSKGPALIAFMQQNIWKRIAIVCSTESIWFEMRLGLVRQLEAAGMVVLTPASFESGNLKTLGEIRRSGFRIVLVLSYDADAQTVASLAHREGMARSGWAWLVCEEKIGVKDMAGWLWFRPFLAGDMQAFAKQVSDSTKSSFNITVSPDSVDLTYSAKLHDAIMLYAHAATTVLSEGGDLRDVQAVTAAVRKTTFVGMGGNAVALDSKGDLVESYEVMNYMVGRDDVMSSVAVGLFNRTWGEYKAYAHAIVWPGGTVETPKDFREEGKDLPLHLPLRSCSISKDVLNAEKPVRFALLLPMTGLWKVGAKIAGAAALAVEKVNADKALLPGRRFEYLWADSGCSAKQGLAAMGQLLGEAMIDVVIGPGCSSACEVTSYLSSGQNTSQISWGCTSPTYRSMHATCECMHVQSADGWMPAG